MSEYFITILTFAYGVCGVVTLLGYLPTLRDLYYGKRSANATTYLIWLVTTFIATLYGFFVIKDFVYLLVVGVQLVACLVIMIMLIRLSCFSTKKKNNLICKLLINKNENKNKQKRFL